MASARYAWGIDIGNRALKAVKLVRENDQLRVDDFELIEHESVLSNSGDNRETLIQSALANFVQRHPMKGSAVAVGVSGQQSFARFIKLPPVEEKKIPEIVRFEAIQQIPFPLDDVEWSYQLFRQEDSPDVEVGIFAMRKELVSQHIKYFTDFDMNVQVVQMNPLAVYNAMHYDGRLSGGTTMVIDLGAENTDLIIADKETIWMRSIPIGGNNFTQTLEKAFKLPFAKAEELKRNAATSKYARQIFQAMRPVFADLVAEIQRSVGFYASVHRDSRIRKIMALGGTFRLPGLQKYLQQNLQLDVERPDNIAAGTPADPKLASTFNENLLSVISAYGLAVQAMGEAKITSSLLPQRIRREKMWKEKTKWFAAAAALFVFGTAIPVTAYFVHDWRLRSNAQEQARADLIQRTASQLDSEWASLESAGSAERAQIANIRAMLDYRDLQRKLLLDLNQAVPEPQRPVQQGLAMIGTDTDAGIKMIQSVPRGQRRQITIENITMQYDPNLSAALRGAVQDATDGTAGAGGAPPPYSPPAERGGGFLDPGSFEDPASQRGGGAAPGFESGGYGEAGGGDEQQFSADGAPAAERGYIVTLMCTSPNETALDELVPEKFIQALQQIKPNPSDPEKRYAVRRAVLVSGVQLKHDPDRMEQIRQEYETARLMRERGQATPGFGQPGGRPPPVNPWQRGGVPPRGEFEGGGMPGPPGAPGEMEAEEGGTHPAFRDRLLGEDIRNDSHFRITLVVVVDPKPHSPDAPAEDEPPAADPAAPPVADAQ